MTYMVSPDQVAQELDNQGRTDTNLHYEITLFHPVLKSGQRARIDISPEEGTQMANKHMQRCSQSGVIHEIQVKTGIGCCYTRTRMAITPPP